MDAPNNIKCGAPGCSYRSKLITDFLPHFIKLHQNDIIKLPIPKVEKEINERTYAMMHYGTCMKELGNKCLKFGVWRRI